MPRKIEAQQDYDMALWHGVISFELMLIHPRKFRVKIGGKGVSTVKPRFTVPELPGPSIYRASILSPEGKLYV